MNEQIRISPIRLIAEGGGQIGIVSLDEARARAAEMGLDLVEVAPDSRPPVVRMMDYGKYKYKAARAAREARRKQHTTQIKEVKFRRESRTTTTSSSCATRGAFSRRATRSSSP